ncbi:MAG: 3-methyl-2-oxobutanoate hydroxymethyltransferase [Spirochaetia bacterium]|nr:3-methyl-2-oxobutanoate hydroxymethyltransferase [Spirochaetota bacterium]MCX8095956.1 3-methyl-2-oxobutanoate hydroxymethyltransferase [Spirochaetota bacterium]MDW8112208.1 3-methyl-2-oxobutanoate hydroxymethyltransferase [Spirochaetia bacterium]
MVSPETLIELKRNGQKISMITCYDYPTAKTLSDSDIDVVLVGDSLGMVVYGYSSTVNVNMDQMFYHTEAVARGLGGSKLLVSDMPFLSYQASTQDAVLNAGRLVRAGANMVKIEGGRRVIDKIKAIVDADIPVMGHLGLTPQSINITGGYKLQAKTQEKIEKLFEDCFLLEREGCFAIVLELVPEEVAKVITENLKIPTIGIGAGRFCDGQVLVINDLLGYYQDFKPKHVKNYLNLSEQVLLAVNEFVRDVKSLNFPSEDNLFKLKEQVDLENIVKSIRNKL